MKRKVDYKKNNVKTLFTALAMGMIVALIFLVKDMIKVNEIQTVMDAFENIQVQKIGERTFYSSKINNCIVSYGFFESSLQLELSKDCKKSFSNTRNIHSQILKRAIQTEDFSKIHKIFLPGLSRLYPDFSKNKILIENIVTEKNLSREDIVNKISELKLLDEITSMLKSFNLPYRQIDGEKLFQVNQSYLEKYHIDIKGRVTIPYDFEIFTVN